MPPLPAPRPLWGELSQLLLEPVIQYSIDYVCATHERRRSNTRSTPPSTSQAAAAVVSKSHPATGKPTPRSYKRTSGFMRAPQLKTPKPETEKIADDDAKRQRVTVSDHRPSIREGKNRMTMEPSHGEESISVVSAHDYERRLLARADTNQHHHHQQQQQQRHQHTASSPALHGKHRSFGGRTPSSAPRRQSVRKNKSKLHRSSRSSRSPSHKHSKALPYNVSPPDPVTHSPHSQSRDKPLKYGKALAKAYKPKRKGTHTGSPQRSPQQQPRRKGSNSPRRHVALIPRKRASSSPRKGKASARITSRGQPVPSMMNSNPAVAPINMHGLHRRMQAEWAAGLESPVSSVHLPLAATTEEREGILFDELRDPRESVSPRAKGGQCRRRRPPRDAAGGSREGVESERRQQQQRVRRQRSLSEVPGGGRVMLDAQEADAHEDKDDNTVISVKSTTSTGSSPATCITQRSIDFAESPSESRREHKHALEGSIPYVVKHARTTGPNLHHSASTRSLQPRTPRRGQFSGNRRRKPGSRVRSRESSASPKMHLEMLKARNSRAFSTPHADASAGRGSATRRRPRKGKRAATGASFSARKFNSSDRYDIPDVRALPATRSPSPPFVLSSVLNAQARGRGVSTELDTSSPVPVLSGAKMQSPSAIDQSSDSASKYGRKLDPMTGSKDPMLGGSLSADYAASAAGQVAEDRDKQKQEDQLSYAAMKQVLALMQTRAGFAHAMKRIKRLETSLAASKEQHADAQSKLAATERALAAMTARHADEAARLARTDAEFAASRGELRETREALAKLAAAHGLGEALVTSRAGFGGGHLCALFRKHGRRGKPHDTTVVVSFSSREILWGKSLNLTTMLGGGAAHGRRGSTAAASLTAPAEQVAPDQKAARPESAQVCGAESAERKTSHLPTTAIADDARRGRSGPVPISSATTSSSNSLRESAHPAIIAEPPIAPKRRFSLGMLRRTITTNASSEHRTARDKDDAPKHKRLAFDGIAEVRPGKATDVFGRVPSRDSVDARCLSLVGRARTLDLECASVETRDLWLELFRRVLLLEE